MPPVPLRQRLAPLYSRASCVRQLHKSNRRHAPDSGYNPFKEAASQPPQRSEPARPPGPTYEPFGIKSDDAHPQQTRVRKSKAPDTRKINGGRSPWPKASPKGVETRAQAPPKDAESSPKAPPKGAAPSPQALEKDAAPSLKTSYPDDTASLMEQLFPEEEAQWNEEADKSPSIDSEAPRVPFATENQYQPFFIPKDNASRVRPEWITSREAAEEAMREYGHRDSTPILLLRNAGPHLLEEDFRRVIPQGRHMEGWRLTQGDIERVVPERNMVTLEPTGNYYIFFASALSAFAYQGHVTRIAETAKLQRPASVRSVTLPPPPGYEVDGMDAHAAMLAYALLAPTQKIELRQLRRPLTPAVDALLKHGGYPSLVSRPDRLPFEARLTIDGTPQTLHQILNEIRFSGIKRGRSWSSEEEELVPRITRWEPQEAVMPQDMSVSYRAQRIVERAELRAQENIANFGNSPDNREEEEEEEDDVNARPRIREGESDPKQSRPQDDWKIKPVYIVGFHTQEAMQSFVLHWHRRFLFPDGWERKNYRLYQGPPILNLEALW